MTAHAVTARRCLAAIGTAAGLFSGLFGVGGGTVIVPLLVLWLGYGEREATGTSLAAIVFIAAVAAADPGGLRQRARRDGAARRAPRGRRRARRHLAAAARRHRAVALLFAACCVAVAVELVMR